MRDRLPEHSDGHPNQVLVWVQNMLDALARDGTVAPTVATRIMAMESLAVLKAVQDTPDGASQDAAIASAAATVLANALPDQAKEIRKDLAESLSHIQDGRHAEKAGVAFGAQVAHDIILARADDGSQIEIQYEGGYGPGQWHPEDGAAPVTPQWGQVMPFIVHDAIDLAGPPSIDSPEFAAALDEVKTLGEDDSTVRTEDQTEAAVFWSNDSGTYTAPGHLDAITLQIVKGEGLDTPETATLFAELNVAMADAAIASWKEKYEDDFWRPDQAVQVTDPDWQPLLPTPAHPDYPSGHAVFAGAWETVIVATVGEQAIDATSLAAPGVVRHFDTIEAAAAEDAQSRIYAGVHFQFSAQDGLQLGQDVAENVLGAFQDPALIFA